LIGKVRSHIRYPFLLLFVAASALFASGCLWGVVTDSETGAPLRGVNVTYVDSYGQTFSTTTDENGMYAFDQAKGPVPARGAANVTVDAAGYEPMTVAPLIEFNENPGASLANLSSFWEVQNLAVSPPDSRYHVEEGGYSLTFPPNWEVMTEPDSAGATAVSPPTDPFGMCASVSGPWYGEIDPAVLVNGLMRDIRGDCVDFKENSRTSTEIDMMPATRLVFSCTLRVEIEGVYRTADIKAIIYFGERADTLYMLMCSSQQSAFPGRQLVFDEIASGFRTD